MKKIIYVILAVWAYMPSHAQCPDPGTTDNADPQITSMTFDQECMPPPSQNGEALIKLEWLMNINLIPNPTDENLMVCTAPAGTWGLSISLPGHIDAYGGAPYDLGDLADIVNGESFDWVWDADEALLTGISNVDMTLDLNEAIGNPDYSGPGGEISIRVVSTAVTSCNENIYSNVNVLILPNFQGGCVQAYANDATNDAQESSTAVKLVLPVEFSRFQITKSDCEAVVLEWDTEIEIDNAGFEIQRSIGGTNKFEKLGYVEGHNNSTAAISYTYEDKDVASLSNQTVYYRLKQIDHNGTFEYSNILSSRFECSRTFGIEIYPNPVINDLQFELDGDRSQVRVIQIVDNLGKLVRSFQFSELESDQISLKGLSVGVYNIKFLGHELQNLETKQLIKLQGD